MDECPKCGKWLLAYYPSREEYECFNCHFKKKESYKKYIKKNNILPKLAKSLDLRGMR